MAQYPANIDLSGLDGTTGFKLIGATAYDASGVSVASAGDVNGDGFADLIIGAFGADPHGTNSGASYVVFGKASGFAASVDLSSLNGSNGFKLSGGANDDYSGGSVASAGDVNGDGFADLIIGAAGSDAGSALDGASYVVFGKASGFAANVDLSTLNGTDGFKLSGSGVFAQTGFSVSSAGDVNHDGFDDVIVGAPLASPHGPSSGASYVVFGKASSFAADIALTTLNGTTGFKLSGVDFNHYSGFSVASAGDINGDGFADLVVGAPSADKGTYSAANSGMSYVVFGKASGFAANVDLSSLNGTTGFRLSGTATNDYSGISVATAGDVNGDGFADLIVGAIGPGSRAGASYVVFGKASGFAASIDLSSLNGTTGFKLSGVAANDLSGFSVAAAGDVNGDGFADVIVGAPAANGTGASYVVFGQASGFAANIDLSSLNGINGFKLSGVAITDGSGFSAASAGDVNGDGLADLIIGAQGADPNGTDSGASYVVLGRLPDTAVNRTGTNASQTLVGGDFGDTLSALGGNDKLYGHGGDDNVNGGAGADQMWGGSGGDTYFVDNAGDVVIENAGEGIDTVYADFNYLLGANVEQLYLQESAGAATGVGNGEQNLIVGNSFANALDGGANNDTLQGGGGNDTLLGGTGTDGMIGGIGNDTYFVDSVFDVIVENAGEGIDTVYSNSNYIIGTNVEQLYLQESGGTATGVGNGEQNLIVGNSFDNVLDGGSNNDQLEGGGGNDTLEGGTGTDGMIGGTGNDTYFVDSVFDVIVENAGGGIDTVYTNSNYIIGANVEQLYLMESAGTATGVGNGEQNLLVGNSFNNTLDGGSNNDTLQGGGGDDTLFGGTGIDGLQGDAGNDHFVFNPGTAAGDVIVDFAGNGAAAGDHLSFVGFGGGATFTQQDATHWVLTYNGGANTEIITFQNAASIDASDFMFL